MNFRSLRLRLTLWNIAVLAIVLASLGSVLRYSVQSSLWAAEDKRMANRVQHMLDRWNAFTPAERIRLAGSLRNDSFPLLRLMFPRTSLFNEERTFRSRSEEDAPSGQLLYKLLDANGNLLLTGKPDPPWDMESFRAAVNGQQKFTTMQIDGVTARVLSAPVIQDGQVRAVFQLARSMEDVERQVTLLTQSLLTMIPITLFIVGVSGAFLTSRALRPVRRITKAAEQMGANDLSQRLDVPGGDEFTRLASTFNALFERLELAFEQQRRFAQDASHELRTPLTGIKANTSLALSGKWTEDEYRATITRIDSAATRMQRLIQDLLLLASSDAHQLCLETRSLRIADVLEDSLRALPENKGGPEIVLDLPHPNRTVLGDAHNLERLFINLLENALRHTPPEGRITLSVRENDKYFFVTITDTGCGIPPEHLPRIQERFYRVDSSRSRPEGGTGLGLAICKSIVEAHYGTLHIESQLGKGTSVTVALPLG